MIGLSKLTGPISNHILSRARHCSAVKVGHGVYRVSPMTRGFRKHRNKTKRRVTFGLDENNKLVVDCCDWYTGAVCEANDRENLCCHVLASFWRFEKSIKRELRNAA